MRVLIINPGIHVYGGAELLIVRLANYMTKQGIENALLTTSILPEMAEDFINTELIVVPSSRKRFGEHIALHKGIRENIKNFNVLNPHNYPAELSVFPYSRPIVWMCNEPFLYLMQNLRTSLRSKLKNKSLLYFEKFITKFLIDYAVVADEYNAKRFKTIYGSQPEIIHYGIDYEFFSKGQAKGVIEEFGLSDNFIILHVGWLNPFKNQIESLKALNKLKDMIPNVKLVLAGYQESTYKSALDKYIKEKQLSKWVLFTGHIDRAKIRDLYHACHVLLHPIKAQGGWLSAFEALCAEKPIVVSKEMTASYIIEREQIGTVTNDFANAIYDIYNNPEKYHEVGKQGRKWVTNNLSWEKFSESMVKLFYKALNG